MHMEQKPKYNVVDATKMPGKTAAERNMNAMNEAVRMANENPGSESTFFKFDKEEK